MNCTKERIQQKELFDFTEQPREDIIKLSYDGVKIEPRNFEKDLKHSNRKELTQQWEDGIKKIFGNNTKIYWKDSKEAQLDFGTDMLIITEKNRKYSIDRKTKAYKYYDGQLYVIELKHHQYKDKEMTQLIESKDGWLYKSTADFILYGTYNNNEDKLIEFCLFSLMPFKDEKFKSRIEGDIKQSFTPFDYCWQRTIFKLAHIDFLKQYANKFEYWRE